MEIFHCDWDWLTVIVNMEHSIVMGGTPKNAGWFS